MFGKSNILTGLYVTQGPQREQNIQGGNYLTGRRPDSKQRFP
jgi:hypothetical protein